MVVVLHARPVVSVATPVAARRRTPSALLVGLVVVAGGVLAACGEGAPSAAPSTTRTVTVTAAPASPTPVPSDTAVAPPEPSEPTPGTSTTASEDGSGDVAEREPSGEQVFLVGARVGTHEGYDRVVWELEGDGVPGWRIGWTDDPRRDGSGDPVDLPGEATLQVVLIGVGIPPDAPSGVTVYDGPQRLAGGATELVTEVEVGQVFEGYLTGFVGAREESDIEVTLLSDPTRVVVDIEH